MVGAIFSVTRYPYWPVGRFERIIRAPDEGIERALLSQNSLNITMQLCLYWKRLLKHGVNGVVLESPQLAEDETPSLCLSTVCVGCLSILTSLKIQHHRNVMSIFWVWLRSSLHSSNQCLQNTYCVPLCTAAVFSKI